MGQKKPDSFFFFSDADISDVSAYLCGEVVWLYFLCVECSFIRLQAEVWVEAVTKGGRRFMAAWRQEEEDAARHRQEKREATRLGKLQSHTEA